jgi:hypothetical protein
VLDLAEAAVDTVLPGALRALYLATDGVFDKDGRWSAI